MHIRPASAVDARSLSELLNEIIALGGTTALKTLTKADMITWIVSNPAQYAFLMAEDERGDALGFQAIGPRKSLPPEACDIATFTRSGKAQLGIGSALFSTTEKKAKALGYRWINATILNQNTGGQAYYQSRGFEPYQYTSERVFMRFLLH
ncbi:MAG: GNAT family N-acetyltransferase [Lentibacter sp.]|jgi:L-amino acid N-acyltransferase YncA|uniref:GNAT family N-acetyltransferase n=1 Tax=Lentibacter sp. TaxID=2024994 RepID=UPI002632D39A|nr:GNAT family N-acetyltransferase [Lentibacter sp.]MDG1289751.1 GNAT family N-acetyltransferase [Lentibacter sp.]